MKVDVPTRETAARLLLAVALGATVGWERERKHKPIGLKTHAMVALGLAAGAGQYVLAGKTVVLALLILTVMAGIESRFGRLYRNENDHTPPPDLPSDVRTRGR